MNLDEAMELVGQFVTVEFGAEVDAAAPLEQTPPKAKARPLASLSFGRKSTIMTKGGGGARELEEPVVPDIAHGDGVTTISAFTSKMA